MYRILRVNIRWIHIAVKWLLHEYYIESIHISPFTMESWATVLWLTRENATMPQTSFEIDEKTSVALEHLKKVYGVPSNAAVVKRALAIALAASKFADQDYNIHIRSEAN